MSWSTGLEALMADGVAMSPLSSLSTDGYGTETYGTASTFKARAVRKQQMVRTFAGTEELSHTTVYVASTSTANWSPYSRVTVNGSTLGPIMSMEAYPDEDGVHHLKLFFGN